MEFDARAQRELDRGRIRQLPLGGEQRLELEGIRIAVDQRVPALVVHHHAGAQIVVIGIDVGKRIAHHDPQRVGGFLSRRGHRTGAEQSRRQNCRTELVLQPHIALHYPCFVKWREARPMPDDTLPFPGAGRTMRVGASWRQRSTAMRQRGLNRQPGGILAGSGMASPRPMSGTPLPGSGVSTLSSSACV